VRVEITLISLPPQDVSQAEAEQVFFNDPLLIVEDIGHSFRETRLHALGRTDAGRLLHISFTLRGGSTMRSPRTMFSPTNPPVMALVIGS
jgi:uncharacterized DUF497 family protein